MLGIFAGKWNIQDCLYRVGGLMIIGSLIYGFSCAGFHVEQPEKGFELRLYR